MGAEAFGGIVQSPGKAAWQGRSQGDKHPNLSLCPLLSFLQVIDWMTPMNPREQDTKRCSLRKLAFWDPEQGEEGREWI